MTDFMEKLQKKKALSGIPEWLICPDCDGGEFGVICTHNPDNTFISGIVCASEACAGKEGYAVTNGFIGGTVAEK